MNNHNLDIHKYSFKDILNLFDLNENEITSEDIKRAKMIVLKTHPDKSHLSSDYFLFYKKAFSIVADFYKEQIKINQEIPTEENVYNPKHEKTEGLNEVQIKKAISKLDSGKFQETFNQLFDSNMKISHDTPEKNRWKQDTNKYEIPVNVTKSSMNENFNKMKQQQGNNLIVYKGVQELHSVGGNPFYEEDEEDASNYITSDPFSKLKFDDLRKVHNDQSIFSVSEKDFDKVTKYKSYDDFQQTRAKHNLNPINKQEAQNMLDLQEKQLRENLMKKEYKSKLQTMKFDDKRKAILSKFLLLK